MRRVLSSLVTIAWGLWFGGLVAVFLAVTSLFSRTFADDRHLAGTAAAGVFRLFEKYQLGLAAAALLGSFLWRVAGQGAPRLKTGLFAIFALTTLVAVVQTTLISPRIEALRLEGLTDSTEFKSLHGKSMAHYVGETALLLVGGFLLPAAIGRDTPGRSDEPT